MNELPLWPPLVALAIGVIGYLYTIWETRRFDRKYPEKAPRRD